VCNSVEHQCSVEPRYSMDPVFEMTLGHAVGSEWVGARRALQNCKRLYILLRAYSSIVVTACGRFFPPSLQKEVFLCHASRVANVFDNICLFPPLLRFFSDFLRHRVQLISFMVVIIKFNAFVISYP
jgi:hypothetical protein